jgi:hypothetical protein
MVYSSIKYLLISFEFKKSYSKELLKIVNTNNGSNSLIISSNSSASKDLRNYIIKQCSGYPETSYYICSLI